MSRCARPFELTEYLNEQVRKALVEGLAQSGETAVPKLVVQRDLQVLPNAP